ncbi:MAG: SPOR domain-containing protein [Pseudomonadota bacterium]
MADPEYDEFDGYSAPRPGRYQRVINLAGAATSLALVIGLGIWGYKLAVRDVTGVPVVRAALEPMRIAPENPGGTVADYQGLSVNDIAAEGTAAPPPDRLVLAPRPVELSLEDGAGLTAAPPLDPAASGAAEAAAEAAAALPVAPAETEAILGAPDVTAPVAPTETAPVAEFATDAVTDAVTDPVADSSINDAVTAALAEALADGSPDLSDLTEPEPDAAPDGAVTRSPLPRRRGGDVASGPTPGVQQAPPAAAETAVAAETAPAEPATATAATAEVDAATLTAGTRLVQLGAFDSADQAREEWGRLQGQFGALLTGKSLVVEPATSGGSTFYRLRALGFESEDDARRLCAALMPDHDNCIPVTQR